MTSRRDRLIRGFAAAIVLHFAASCDQQSAELAPLEQARQDLAEGDAVGAEIALARLVEKGAPRADVAALMGEAALIAGDLAEARRWLGPGEFSDATRAHGYRMLGRLEMAEGNLAAAGRAFDAALETDPDDPELWVDIGRLRYRGGEQEAAIAAAERAVAVGPNSAAALQFRGQIARDSEGLEPAARWFARALERRPHDAGLRADYAATLGDAGRAVEALAVLREGRQVAGPHLSRFLYIQAVLAARGGDYNLARSLLDRSGEAGRGIPAALMLSALLDVAEENYASAAQTLDRLSGLQPDNRRVEELLAHALSRSGGERELVERFGARALGPGGSPYLRVVVGRALEALGERDRAARYLDAAAQSENGLSTLTPAGAGLDGSGTAYRDAVRTAIAARQFDLAVTRAESFVRRFPGSGDALALLGDARLARGDRADARAAYAQSARVRQPWPLTLRMLAAQASPRDGARLLADYLRAHPMNGAAAALLADAYAAEGEWERAAVLLDHAIANGQGRAPFVVAARSVAASRIGDEQAALDYALLAHEIQPLSAAATAALIAALPPAEQEARAELEQKLRSLQAR